MCISHPGVLPRKALELAREWVAPGLARLSPSLRTGPLLIEPDQVRLPKVSVFGAKQVFTRRDTPATWRDDPILSRDPDRAAARRTDDHPGGLHPRDAGDGRRDMTAYDWPRVGRPERRDDRQARRSFNASRGTFAGGTLAEAEPGV